MSYYGSANKPTYSAKIWIEANPSLQGRVMRMDTTKLELYIRGEFKRDHAFGSVKTIEDLNRINWRELVTNGN
jgi:hypothetical protein